MTEHKSKSTSAQVTKYAELSMQCPVSWGKQHCTCNEVEQGVGGGGVTNKSFALAELLNKHSWRQQIRNSALQGRTFLHEMKKSFWGRLSNRRQITTRCVLFCGPQFGEIFFTAAVAVTAEPSQLFWGYLSAEEAQRSILTIQHYWSLLCSITHFITALSWALAPKFEHMTKLKVKVSPAEHLQQPCPLSVRDPHLILTFNIRLDFRSTVTVTHCCNGHWLVKWEKP